MEFAWQVAERILDSPHFRTVLREVVLRVLLDQESQRELGAVRAFLNGIDAQGITARVDDAGKLLFTNASRLSADLQAVLKVYRLPIYEHFQMIRDLKAKDVKPVHKPGVNGAVKQPQRR